MVRRTVSTVLKAGSRVLKLDHGKTKQEVFGGNMVPYIAVGEDMDQMDSVGNRTVLFLPAQIVERAVEDLIHVKFEVVQSVGAVVAADGMAKVEQV